MTFRRLCVVLLFVFTSVGYRVQVAEAKIHVGIGYLGAWDFSDSAEVATDEWDLDVQVTITDRDLRFNTRRFVILVAHPPTGGITLMPPDSTYETLSEAPADPAAYVAGIWFEPNRTWVVRTKEGHYAKLQFVDDLELTMLFYYTYQDDGTRFFYDPQVPVEKTTWGQIKLLYE